MTKIRWIWLLVSSYYFYMNWHAEYALLMAASTVVTYACALLVSRFEKQKTRKLVLIAGIVFNVGLLGYFKYTGMFIDVLNRVCGALGFALRLPQVDILLPVGIGFFTFQALGWQRRPSAPRWKRSYRRKCRTARSAYRMQQPDPCRSPC